MTKSKKKHGGDRITNPSNTHDPKDFGSTQGLVSGCSGCVNGNVSIGSGCNLENQAAAQVSANRGISRFMNGITGKIFQGGGPSNTTSTTFNDLKNAAENGMGYGLSPVTGDNNCGVKSSTSMGAGQISQTGGGVSQTSSCVSGVNNLGTPGYGLNIAGN